MRAGLLGKLRKFFQQRGILEVETPILSRAGATDLHLSSFRLGEGPATRYLATSPEFPMKRLLAAGAGSIYQIARVFRQGEAGRHHNPEFTMLEWYRPGYSMQTLMQEVVDLIRSVEPEDQPFGEVLHISYRQAFLDALDLDPLKADTDLLRRVASERGIDIREPLDKNAWLDLLFESIISSNFPDRRLTFVYDYPASQAALARLKPQDQRVAERFELYLGAGELANGYCELTDASEQAKRFAADNEQRLQSGLDEVPVDRALLDALKEGLPYCSGVALGLDRLLIVLAGAEHIRDVIAFDWQRA